MFTRRSSLAGARSGRNSALDYAGKRSEDEIQRIREARAEEDKKKNEQMAQVRSSMCF